MKRGSFGVERSVKSDDGAYRYLETLLKRYFDAVWGEDQVPRKAVKNFVTLIKEDRKEELEEQIEGIDKNGDHKLAEVLRKSIKRIYSKE